MKARCANMQRETITSCYNRTNGKLENDGALQYLVNAPLLQNVRSGTCNARDVGMIRLSGVDGTAGQWKGTRALLLK